MTPRSIEIPLRRYERPLPRPTADKASSTVATPLILIVALLSPGLSRYITSRIGSRGQLLVTLPYCFML